MISRSVDWLTDGLIFTQNKIKEENLQEQEGNITYRQIKLWNNCICFYNGHYAAPKS